MGSEGKHRHSASFYEGKSFWKKTIPEVLLYFCFIDEVKCLYRTKDFITFKRITMFMNRVFMNFPEQPQRREEDIRLKSEDGVRGNSNPAFL